ncbi:winged helix-turn-helix domain-containing protein [Rasiella sp. SM2506]|uniref:winged helix-turn-helix domain-containing protein n=1 Tax=Rasiella sp. SM2506 TaxID=3423914 RepID=UPI003D7B83FA
MNKTIQTWFRIFGISAALSLLIACSTKEQEIPTEEVKVALRSIGNQILIAQNDTTSLVLPILEKSPTLFELSFEKPLAFDPADLNQITTSVFESVTIPNNYIVEVLQCEDGEVAYSYKIANQTEQNIIPCSGRIISEGCYTIQVKFMSKEVASKNATLFFVLIFLVVLFLGFVFYSKYHAFHSEKETKRGTSLGHFSFYPEQNKLVKEAQEIPLTQKECELLAILIEHPNQVVKREELTKRVWEDNGVIVGRSLDTYISKLRKKLEDDATIKITNVHGVGYKLEIDRLV